MNSKYESDRWEKLDSNRFYTANLCKEQVLLRMTEGCPWVEEIYNCSVEKLQENSIKNYSKILAPLKIRSAHLLNPITNQPL